MMPHGAPAWTYLIPLVFVGLAIVRNARARNLKVERLWIMPSVILVATALTFSQQRMPAPAMILVDIALLAAGAGLGWWRARFTRITVNPETHNLTSQASPIGMLLILGIFALRFGLRSYAAQNAGALHVSITDITDGFLLLAVGLVCAQRLELALRATRLLNEARAAKSAV
jgi:hypothetical protein